MLPLNEFNRFDVNVADGMIVRWEFLYFTFIMSVVKH